MDKNTIGPLFTIATAGLALSACVFFCLWMMGGQNGKNLYWGLAAISLAFVLRVVSAQLQKRWDASAEDEAE